MITSRHSTKKQLIFAIKKINSKVQLRNAVRHNKREIAKELGAAAHIDAAKIHLNYSLTGSSDGIPIFNRVKNAIDSYEKNTKRAIRRDAVIAIEILFSVSAANSDVDLQQYFQDCLRWSKSEFAPAELLSADVHLDESNPHMHAIFLCVTKTHLVASALAGYKTKYRHRLEDFFRKVGEKHGLELPPPTMSRINRELVAKQVIDHIDYSNDPITRSRHYPAVRDAIKKNPIPFAFNLDLDVVLKIPKTRTFAQIFTSKGRGSSIPDRE
jgi:hypothetical protein